MLKMKLKFPLFLTVFLASWILSSCEDVIEVDPPSEAPRLIVDALIRVDINENFTNVIVKVQETNSFFETLPPANLNQITLVNLTNPPSGDEPILFEESPGVYSRMFPTNELMTDEYVLQINFEDNEIYLAFASFVPTVDINSIEQGDETLFDEDDTEVILSFTDFPDREDYYLFDFDFNNFITAEDTFFDGQEFEFSYFYDELIESGDQVEISILGVDESLYNYMNLLIDQSGEFDIGAFATPAVTARGNIINATDIDNIDVQDNLENPNNFALGYFAIVEERKQTFTFQ